MATSGGTFFSRPMEEEWEFFEKLSKGSKTQASVDRNNNHTSSANFVSNQHGTNSEISELSKKVDLLLRNLGKGVPNVSHDACSMCGDPSHSVNNCQSWGAPSNEEVNGVYEPVHETTHSPKATIRDVGIIPTSVGKMTTIARTIPNKTMVTNQGMRVAIHLTSNKTPTNKGHSNTKIMVKPKRCTNEKRVSFQAIPPSIQSIKPDGPDHVNMMTSLRSGKTYNSDIKIPSVHDFSHDVEDFVTDNEIIVEGKKVDNVKSDSELVNDLLKDLPKPPTQNPEATESPKVGEGGVSSTTTPYPAALEKSASARLAKKGPYSEDMWETFKQRKLKATLPKKIDLTEHVSAVLSSSLPPKFKDPGAPLISVVVGNIAIKKALLDLGASINILPASLVDKYDLGTFRKTDTIISLADRSTKIPRGILEDVIVKVDDFYYPVDFFVMDTESPYKDVQPTIILGRLFLATIDAWINCRTGAMDIAFGNKKLRLNVFNSVNSPTMNECYQVDVIDEEVQKHAPRMLKDDLLELYLTGENEEILDVTEVQEIQECLVSSLDHQRPPWSYKVEPLPTNFDTAIKPSLEVPPTLELKPLPSNLKYAFLGPNNTLPVIVASDLFGLQEEALLKVLSKYKAAVGWTITDLKGISPSLCEWGVEYSESTGLVGKPKKSRDKEQSRNKEPEGKSKRDMDQILFPENVPNST
ncbi:putative nucleotidyltransferase, ribonuclease H [Tanacetum coccineum]